MLKGGVFVFGFKTFKGGIHPDDKKRNSNFIEIENFSAPKTMIYPVQQHIGKPANVVVNVGDDVKIGQLIAGRTGMLVQTFTPLSAVRLRQ